jgi:hypothetical protein
MGKSKISKEELLHMIASRRTVGHKDAARGQLEQALFLWFHKDDPHVVSDHSSIHTLAVAVQGVLSTYAKKSRPRQPPPMFTQMIEGNRAKLDRLKDTQNFFKHGGFGRRKEKPKSVAHLPDLTDMILADNVSAFNRLFRSTSALMDLFLLRYSWSFPASGISIKTLEMKLISSGHDLKTLAGLNRKEFYEFISPYAVANLREQTAARTPA